MFFAYFSFKQTMHRHIGDRKEIPNDVKHLTFHFSYAEAYKCQDDYFLVIPIKKSDTSVKHKRLWWILDPLKTQLD